MAAKLGQGGKKAIVDINITPFVDIILVVLIIFMVTSTVVASEAIPVTLPEAATGEASPSEPTSLALVVQSDGSLYLDGQPTDELAIRRRLRSGRAAGEEIVCLIGADADTRHALVVGLVDLVRQEGISRFALEVDPKPLPPEAKDRLP